MSQPRGGRRDDLFRRSLEKIINLRHPLVRLAAEIVWDFLTGPFSPVCRLGPGQPPFADNSRTVHPQAHAQSL
jgi:IS5 family transposase